MSAPLERGFLDDCSRSHFIPAVKQSIYNKAAGFNLFQKNKRTAYGTAIEWDTIASKAVVGQPWYSGYDPLVSVPIRPTRKASLSPANLAIPMSLANTEIRQNSGNAEKLVDMLKTQFDNAQATMIDILATSVFSDGTQVGNRAQLVGTKAAVANNNTYAGIDRTAAGNDFWKANVDSTAHTYANLINPSHAEYLPKLMRKKITDCTLEMEPDIMFTHPDVWNMYQDIMQGSLRLTVDDANAGFRAVNMGNISLVYDKYAPLKHLYFFNTNDWALYVYPDADITMTGWKEAESADVMINRLIWSGQLVCERPVQQGVISDISTS